MQKKDIARICIFVAVFDVISGAEHIQQAENT